MKLAAIHLQNFRLFKDFSCNFDGNLTVLVADNGGGKTTVLEAIALQLLHTISQFHRPDSPALTKEKDVHTFITNRNLGQKEKSYPLKIEVQLELGRPEKCFTCQFDLANEASKPSTTVLRTDGTAQEMSESGANNLRKHIANAGNLPLLALYGTNRLAQTKWQRQENSQASQFAQRQAGYDGAAQAGASISRLMNWLDYANRSNVAEFSRYLAQHPDLAMRFSDFQGAFSPLLKAVQQAVNNVLAHTKWQNLYYVENLQDAVLEHPQLGTQPLSRLSDGLRTTIGLVADLALRAVQLNPHLGENAARETEGIVMIDEVDMHLHPQWQQMILPDLMRTFPKVQFIVTTHSPQVLSTVKRENIRLLSLAQGTEPLAMSYGEPSGNVLQSVMLVDPQPPVPEKRDLQNLTALVDQGRYEDEATRDLQSRLTVTLGEQHPQLQRLQRSITRQKMLKPMVQKK